MNKVVLPIASLAWCLISAEPSIAGWYAGATVGCFDTYQQALAAACANQNPDTTDPTIWFYRDSCVMDTASSHIVHAHGFSLLTGDIAYFNYSGSLATCTNTIDVGKNLGAISVETSGYCPTGNPINQGTGNKLQVETDYKGNSLEFSRYYNSTPIHRPGISGNWLHSYSSALSVDLATMKVAYRPDGKALSFSLDTATGQWIPAADTNHGLIQLKDTANNPTGWVLTVDHNSQIETYDISGKLLSIATSNGSTQTLSYSTVSTPAAVAPKAGLLIAVSDSFGRSLSFTYDSSARIKSMTDPSGAVTAYNYDPNNNLTTVTYPDNTPNIATDNPTLTHVYGEFSSQSHALTGIVDENGNRFATWKYDTIGRAISSEHAGGVEQYSLAYGSDGRSVEITDPLGAIRNTQFTSVLGVIKSTNSDQPAGAGCLASASGRQYDANGNLASQTDFNGNLSCYAYDLSRNLETVRVEGLPSGSTCPADPAAYNPPAGSSIRKVVSQWHATYRLPTQIDEAGQRSQFSYDAGGNLLSKTVTDTATHQSRTWSYTYNSLGQMLTENGPRSDIADVTTYTYYSDSTATHKPGDQWKVTNALGHTTTFTAYDANGRLLSLTDPNGLAVGLSYDTGGRLIQKTIGGNTTRYNYDPSAT